MLTRVGSGSRSARTLAATTATTLRPSSFSLITLAGVNLGRLIGGTIIIEKLFGLGGVGTLVTQAIPQKDFPVLQGSVLILAVAYLLINTTVDIGYNFIDPRVRRGTS